MSAQVNQRISKTAHIRELNSEIERLKEELFATREKNGVYVPLARYEVQQEEEKGLKLRFESLEMEVEQTRERHHQEQELVSLEWF